MKTLSEHNPWGPMIVGLPGGGGGPKDVENRSSYSHYRGPVLIHAAKVPVDVRGVKYLRALCELEAIPRDQAVQVLEILEGVGAMARGAIIGQARVADVVRDSDSSWAQEGMWHYLLEDRRAFAKPVAYPGRQGAPFFDAPEPDTDHLFKPHDGATRGVCLYDEPPDLVVMRPSIWGNPYFVKERRGRSGEDKFLYYAVFEKQLGEDVRLRPWQSIEEAFNWALRFYEIGVRSKPKLMKQLPKLKGKRLGCMCDQGDKCHRDVLVRLVREVCGG